MSTTWNPMSYDDFDALKGKNVYTSDDEKIGTVDQVLYPAQGPVAPSESYLLVKPSMMERLGGQDELYIPATQVQMVSEDRLVLETTKATAEKQTWAMPKNINSYRRS